MMVVSFLQKMNCAQGVGLQNLSSMHNISLGGFTFKGLCHEISTGQIWSQKKDLEKLQQI